MRMEPDQNGDWARPRSSHRKLLRALVASGRLSTQTDAVVSRRSVSEPASASAAAGSGVVTAGLGLEAPEAAVRAVPPQPARRSTVGDAARSVAKRRERQ
jgi:hypothetical protein